MNAKKIGGRIFMVLFVLAMVARLVRIFAPGGHAHAADHHAAEAHASAQHADAYLTGEVIEHRRFSDELVVQASTPGSRGAVRVRIDPAVTQVRLGSTDVSGDVVQVGDHATVRFASPDTGADGARVAQTIRLAR